MSDNQYRIEVSPAAYFVEEQSDVAADRYVFAYRIRIVNTGQQPAKLLSRHWLITDANGHVQEVRGMGVVGEHPHLKPGEHYEYLSGATLTTPWGTMKGSYQMEADDGTRFDAPIAEFLLAVPRVLH
ncbi:ApaG protein [Crenobacter luteus]|uniref:Protein ApaG n=1 Tax=Crenobacter luteus TaxID=1452487 RepID=A0A161RCE3_9NEIS|nr:Co2+/Mg2+ efflux protein ApaG [Crenobacter luteus]KZE34928.1 Co2+/Mg2+ efflux protein ApaG [Crenobacter luteus]TCP12130.1 ApaG protein [Crenobacter luteus]